MTVSTGCIASVREASGGKLSAAEAIDLLERTERKLKAIEAAGSIDGLDARLAKAAAEAADEAAIERALAAKHAALNIIKRVDLERRVEVLAPKLGELDALLAIFRGTTKRVDGGRYSVQAIRQSLETRFMTEPMAKIAAERPHVEKMLRDKPFLDDVVREMAEIREGGTPGKTRNADARFVAKTLSDAAEASRQALNARGANIGKLDGWAGPQTHDDAKLRKAGQDAWVKAVVGKLDLDRTLPDVSREDMPSALAEVWTNIVTGQDRGLTAAGKGETVGPANLAKSLARNRVLHFRDADAWLAYNADFGSGHVFDGMLQHQRKAARAAAVMEVFGPNPQVMLDSVAESLKLRVRNNKTIDAAKRQKIISELDTEGGALRTAMSETLGLTSVPVDYSAAKISANIRDAQSIAKLGGAVISSATDMITSTANLKFNGVPIGKAYADQIGELVKGRGVGETREISFLLGEGADGLMGHIASAHHANDGFPGRWSKLTETFFRWNGLSWWTDTMRSSHARVLSAHLGLNVGSPHSRIDPQLRAVLATHGIGAAEWDALRQAKFRAVNGNTYVTPDRVRDLPDAAIAPLVEGKATPAKIAAARDQLELKLGAYFADEVGFGVIEADDASRSFWLGTSRPGTMAGEVMRFLMQFKGFPTAFTQRVLGRAVYGGAGETPGERLANNAGHIGHLMAGLFVMGYISMTAKDYVAGLDRPRDPTAPKTILAALKQGGGLGIYGDFLFGEANRFGNGVLETIAGPAIGTGASIINLALRARDGEAKAGDALNIALQNTPYINLFYVRPGLDYLFLNSLRESVSPGFLARQEQRRFKDFGQRYVVDREAFR